MRRGDARRRAAARRPAGRACVAVLGAGCDGELDARRGARPGRGAGARGRLDRHLERAPRAVADELERARGRDGAPRRACRSCAARAGETGDAPRSAAGAAQVPLGPVGAHRLLLRPRRRPPDVCRSHRRCARPRTSQAARGGARRRWASAPSSTTSASAPRATARARLRRRFAGRALATLVDADGLGRDGVAFLHRASRDRRRRLRQRTLDRLEDLRLRLEDRFDDAPGGVTVVVHPSPGWLAAAIRSCPPRGWRRRPRGAVTWPAGRWRPSCTSSTTRTPTAAPRARTRSRPCEARPSGSTRRS